MKIFSKILIATCLHFILLSCHAQKGKDLTVGEFEKGISNKDSIQLLDVRTPGEYNSGHINNAMLADWKNESEFDRRITFIDKEKPVYIYCLGGSRSAEAAAKMRSIGYQQVYELKGGINAWKAENKTVEGKTNEKQMTVDELNLAINASKFVLVDFGAVWCPPCKKMEPVLLSLQNDPANKFTLVKVDGGKDEAILKKYAVTQLPVFIVFKDGKQVWRKDGIVGEKEIADLFK